MRTHEVRAGEDEPPSSKVESRPWTDPRTGERWHVSATPSRSGIDPAAPPLLIVFRSGKRRYWVGYCGERRLGDLDDTDLVLLLDCTTAAAS